MPHVLKTSDCAFIDPSMSKTTGGSVQVDDSQNMGAAKTDGDLLWHCKAIEFREVQEKEGM